MRINVYFLMLLTLIITFILIEKKSSPYGENWLKVFNTLPFGVSPENRPEFQGGFRLRSQYDESLISALCGYRSNHGQIDVKKVLDYSFNEDSIISKISDKSDKLFYVVITKDDFYGDNLKIDVYKTTEFIRGAHYKVFIINELEDSSRFNLLRLILISAIIILVLKLLKTTFYSKIAQ